MRMPKTSPWWIFFIFRPLSDTLYHNAGLQEILPNFYSQKKKNRRCNLNGWHQQGTFSKSYFVSLDVSVIMSAMYFYVVGDGGEFCGKGGRFIFRSQLPQNHVLQTLYQLL